MYKNIIKRTLGILFLSVLSQHSYAQVITGVVTENIGGSKEPVISANVVVVNKNNQYLNGTTTNMDGVYNLPIPAGEKGISIRFSYIGMKSVTVKYVGQKRLDIELKSDDGLELENVEIVAKRIERDQMGISRLEQTTASQKINMEEIIAQEPVASVEEALQGRISGVDIAMGGDPGSKSNIRIRGTSSLSANDEPLIVIDGVPYNDTSTDDFDFSTANEEDFGALLNISPSNIESIEVLKDASATAIYGSKGASGVVLINTKKGVIGKTRFSFSTKNTIKFEPSSIPLLNGDQYTSLMQDAMWNAANAKGVTSATNEMYNLFHNYEILYSPDYRYFNEYNQNTDWLEEVKQDAFVTDNTFSMSGGGDKVTYRFNLGYYNEEGTTRGTGLSRFNTGIKIGYKFSDRLSVNTDFSYTDSDKDGNYASNVRSMAQKRMPNLSPYWINPETGEATDHYFQQNSDFQGNYPSVYNPVAMVNEGFSNTRQSENRIIVSLEYKFPFNLTYQGYVSYNMKKVKNEKFLPQEATASVWTSDYSNQSTDATSDNMSLQTENKLMYNNLFAEKHRLIGTAVFRTSSTESVSVSNVTAGNTSANVTDPSTGGRIISSSSGRSERRSMSLIGQLVYTYDSRYVLRATLNYEGNSAMGADNRWGLFPAFGVAWNIDKEHFIGENVREWLTEAKVRASIGWSGNALSGSTTYMGAYQSLSTYMTHSAIEPVRMQLNKLKWESTEEKDFGFDLRFFDRLGVTVDYYDKRTSDLLLKNPSIPTTTGYSNIKYINSGSLSNKGVEIRADYDIIRNDDWKLNVNMNMSRNVNKVESLPSTWSYDMYTFGNGNYALRIKEGAPVGSFYGYRCLGVYQNVKDTYARDAEGRISYDFKGEPIVMSNGNQMVYPGDAKYEDINHDGVINKDDIVYLGNANPKIICGGGFSLRYKQLTLTAFFYGRFGQKIINSARMDLESMYGTSNQSTAVLSRWRSEGDDTVIPRALYGMGYNYLGSDRFVETASYLRLKTLSVSYNLPKKIIKSLGLNSCNIFATGYNLLTFTDYSGQDPEVELPTATKLVKDDSATPVSRRISFGMNISF